MYIYIYIYIICIYVCVYMYICVTIQNKPAVWAARSRVNSGIFFNWRDKRIGNMVKHDTLEWFYGDKCVSYSGLKETIAKTCNHIQIIFLAFRCCLIAFRC